MTGKRLGPWLTCLAGLAAWQPAAGQALHDYVPPSDRLRSRESPRADRSHMDRQTRLRPDRHTNRYSEPAYRVTFNPTVMPFKRGIAYDAVAPDGSLLVQDPRPRLVPKVPPPKGPGWTKFVARIPLQAGTGPSLMPLPSVAPQMVISRVTMTPPLTQVRVLKDGADNFFLELTKSLPRPATLHMEVWAQSRYFGGPLPRTLAPVPISSQILPPAFARRAAQVIAGLGLIGARDRINILRRLVAYFRSFVPGPLTVNTGNTYLDVALSRRGVCRHRAYAFMVTALALGIRTRMVTNEVHAFVEVNLGSVGWRRIDLGGATPNTVPSRAAVQRHRPPPDPFGWPAGTSHPAPGPGQASSGMDTTGDTGRRARVGASTATAGPQGPVTVVLDLSDQASTFRVGTVEIRTTGLRGSPITVAGRVTASTGQRLSRRIRVILAPLNSSRGYVLGWTTTDATGRFVIRKPIPKSIPVGLYQILVGD